MTVAAPPWFAPGQPSLAATAAMDREREGGQAREETSGSGPEMGSVRSFPADEGKEREGLSEGNG